MADDPLLDRARALWADLARVPVASPRAGTTVVVAPDSRLCPAGWVGVVVLGGAALVTAPDRAVAELLRGRDLTDVDRLPPDLPVTDVLGPAGLAYLDRGQPGPADASLRADARNGPAIPWTAVHRRIARGVAGCPATGSVPVGHPDLGPLLALDDADESGLADIHSAAFVVRAREDRDHRPDDAGAGRAREQRDHRPDDAGPGRAREQRDHRPDDAGAGRAPDDGRIVAAAGYRRWPTGVAHLGVLTAPEHRGRGLARIVAAAATADALANGLLPQWRARVEPSKRVAAALGYRTLGAQVSLRLDRPR